MKKLVATAPRVAALVEYEERAILANEVKIRVRFGAPKHGTEVVDFRAASPFINDDFNGEWQMFTPRPADAPRGIEFGKFQLGNMVVGDIIECGSDVNDYAVGDSVCGYGPLSETVIINAVNNYKLRKMPQGSSWKKRRLLRPGAVCHERRARCQRTRRGFCGGGRAWRDRSNCHPTGETRWRIGGNWRRSYRPSL